MLGHISSEFLAAERAGTILLMPLLQAISMEVVAAFQVEHYRF
jgi:hypothetical protein